MVNKSVSMQSAMLLPTACGGVASNPLAAHIKSVVQLSENCSALTFSDLRILKHYDSNMESIYTACGTIFRAFEASWLKHEFPSKTDCPGVPPNDLVYGMSVWRSAAWQ